MDAVELGYPVDVPKLMGSDGFGRARVTVNEVEAVACESNTRVSIIVNTPIERCSTFLRQKDVTSTVNDLESTWDKIQKTEPRKHDSQLPSLHVEDSSAQLKSGSTSCPSSTSRSEVQRKTGKVSRSSSGCSKRPRLAQLEDNMSSAGVNDIKDISDNVGPHPTNKCNPLEKSQTVKQKSHVSGKRGDKRNFKVSMKAKYDSFSMRAGLMSFSSAAGGNNFFGAYGLKSDIDDITKHVDDLSLRDLLDGTYKCPSLGKDKGKKATNMNESFVQSVRKACSILPLAKPPQSQNFTEVDSCTNKKLVTCPSSSISSVSSSVDVDKGDSCSPGLSSCNKESCSKPGATKNLDFPLYQPKDILERLALPRPKDLEALLLDAAKPSAPSRNNSDIRSGKHISRRASLPPFPWSHTYNGHCRTNSDAVKLLTSRSTCQGRWARINSSAILGASTDSFTNLELLTYDQSLVPPSTSVSTPWCEWGSSSIVTSSKSSLVNPESGAEQKDPVNAGHCPRIVAAAETLCDMAARSSRKKPDGVLGWLKKPSQKAMKARKSKSFEKPGVFITRFSQSGPDNLVRSGINKITPSKRSKLSMMESKKNPSHTNGIRKGLTNWSAPRSSRSSPSKSVRDSIAETKHSTADNLRQSCMMPPPSRVLDKTCNGQQKIQTIMPADWDRGRDRVD
ncbi:uncharacterized protein LOC116107497 isoform X1 [Pistacia vera]|uniref:uncharacterized protein LOC116107497 isoform X1 n=1 Tax=Pistacia vera TaxID=55513 RepID=UPI001263D069|nr:uncharacterized protein LOC116107497 isoform X1 [Pistacia vera]